MRNPPQSPLQVGRECYLRAMGRVLVVEILGMARHTIWVSFPSADAIGEGTGVELEFHDRETVARYHARVAVGSKNGSSGIMLERAESATHLQRRRDWRVPTDFTIWVRPIGEKRKQKGRMLNLTSDGALLLTRTYFEAGDALELIFQLPEFPAHQVVSQVVYCDTTDADGVYRFGLRFLEVKKRAREAITWYLYDRIQDLYMDEIRELYPCPAPRLAPRKAILH